MRMNFFASAVSTEMDLPKLPAVPTAGFHRLCICRYILFIMISIHIYIYIWCPPLYLPFWYFYWYLHAFLTNLEKCYTHIYIHIYIYIRCIYIYIRGLHIVCIKPFSYLTLKKVITEVGVVIYGSKIRICYHKSVCYHHYVKSWFLVLGRS